MIFNKNLTIVVLQMIMGDQDHSDSLILFQEVIRCSNNIQGTK